MKSLLAAAETIVGADNVLAAQVDLARYNSDGRGPGGAARAVVRPKTSAEVSALLREAHQNGTPVVVQGGRSGLSGAGLADDAILMSLERLAGPPRIDPINRTVTVDAGVLLSTVNAAAAEHGLSFPIDLGADPSIGGMVAANTGGARFLRHGDVRRNLLSLDVILADGHGTMLTLGSSVWKDNSGLDLKQLFVSSAGALGVVTSATLALHPLCAKRTTMLVALASADAAIPLLIKLERQAGALLTAFEGISPTALALACEHVPRLKRPFANSAPAYLALIELAGGDSIPADLFTDIAEATIAPMIEDGSAIDTIVDPGEALWAIRHAIPEGLRAAGRVIACDIAVRRGDVMRFRSDLTAEIAARWPDLVVADFGHVGDGGLHFNTVWPHTAGPMPEGLVDAVQSFVFAQTVENFGGSFSAEHGIGPRNIKHYARFKPAPVRALAAQIQQLVAPAGLGRVNFGGEEDAPPITEDL